MEFNWLNLSDLHIATGHIDPSDTYDRIRAVIHPLLPEVDLFSISGDFYDNAMYLEDRASVYGSIIINEIFQKAQQHGFAIRIIRGTYTHDRDQLEVAAGLAKQYPSVDFAYYTKLAVDQIKGVSFVYIPDELGHSADTMDQLIKMVEPYGGAVDCAIVHGYFEHVLPPCLGVGKHQECYNADVLGKYVKRCIIAGHVHTPSVYKNKLWYTGSFDRLNHGEEEEKGCLRIKLTDDHTAVDFIPNIYSTLHITATITKETVEDCLGEVRKVIKRKFQNPPQGYLRISGGQLRSTVASILRNEYGEQLHISEHDNTLKDKSGNKTGLELAFRQYVTDVPNPDNIGLLLHKYLDANIDEFPYTADQITVGLREL